MLRRLCYRLQVHALSIAICYQNPYLYIFISVSVSVSASIRTIPYYICYEYYFFFLTSIHAACLLHVLYLYARSVGTFQVHFFSDRLAYSMTAFTSGSSCSPGSSSSSGFLINTYCTDIIT